MWDRQKKTKFTTWFYRVVINKCLDHKRKKQPVPLLDAAKLEDKKSGHQALLDYGKKQDILERLIRGLPKRQQLALDLCFYQGLSNQEAAEVMGVRLKALQSLIIRAKTNLREKVGVCQEGGSV